MGFLPPQLTLGPLPLMSDDHEILNRIDKKYDADYPYESIPIGSRKMKLCYEFEGDVGCDSLVDENGIPDKSQSTLFPGTSANRYLSVEGMVHKEGNLREIIQRNCKFLQHPRHNIAIFECDEPMLYGPDISIKSGVFTHDKTALTIFPLDYDVRQFPVRIFQWGEERILSKIDEHNFWVEYFLKSDPSQKVSFVLWPSVYKWYENLESFGDLYTQTVEKFSFAVKTKFYAYNRGPYKKLASQGFKL